MRILVIEDEMKLAQAIKRALELQHHAVDAVHDGAVGLDFAMSEKIDIIILDVMLPSLNGIEVCKRLRAEGNNTPVIMLTAKGQVTDRVTGLNVGADDYLVKPFSFEELFARIQALARRASHNHNPILKVKDLELNPATLKVKRAHQSIDLSAKEFAILEYLLRHQGMVLSKDQIVNHVWNYDADVLPTTVEVHVKNLRDKIDKPFKEPLIKTVRGFGYEIED